MLWVTDESGYCTYLNQTWYAFTGQQAREGEGFGWLNAVHDDDRPVAERAFLQANEAHARYEVDFRLRRADGIYRWCIDAAAPRFDGSGRFLGYVGSVIDVDERRDAIERVRRSEETVARGDRPDADWGRHRARALGRDLPLQSGAGGDAWAIRSVGLADTYDRYGGLMSMGVRSGVEPIRFTGDRVWRTR
jgi:PAS domain S-box-containing protein